MKGIKLSKAYLQQRARELGIYGFWLMNKSELIKCIIKAENMTEIEVKSFNWIAFLLLS